jgi:hypothetical protein
MIVNSRFAGSLCAVSAYSLVVFLLAGAIIGLHYYMEHIDLQHGDMFGVRGAFLVGGLLCLVSCVGGASVVAVLAWNRLWWSRFSYKVLIAQGSASGFMSAAVTIAFNPRIEIMLLVNFPAALCLTYIIGTRFRGKRLPRTD